MGAFFAVWYFLPTLIDDLSKYFECVGEQGGCVLAVLGEQTQLRGSGWLWSEWRTLIFKHRLLRERDCKWFMIYTAGSLHQRLALRKDSLIPLSLWALSYSAWMKDLCWRRGSSFFNFLDYCFLFSVISCHTCLPVFVLFFLNPWKTKLKAQCAMKECILPVTFCSNILDQGHFMWLVSTPYQNSMHKCPLSVLLNKKEESILSVDFLCTYLKLYVTYKYLILKIYQKSKYILLILVIRLLNKIYLLGILQ